MGLSVKEVKLKMSVFLPRLRNNLLALSLIALIFWKFAGSGISFWDDFFLSAPNMTTGPSSPLDFFRLDSGFYKSWPITASVIWLFNQIHLGTIPIFKATTWILHIANAILMARFFKSMRAWIFAFFLFHPVAFLTLSWAFQFSAELSIFFALASWLSIEQASLRKSVPFSLLGTALLAGSLLTKPWAGLLVLSAPILILRSTLNEREPRTKSSRVFIFSVLTWIVICGSLASRALEMSQSGLAYFPAETPHRIEFETGVSPSSSPSQVIDERAAQERLSLSTSDATLRKTLFLGDTAFKYLTMLIGVSSYSVIDKRPTEFSLKTIGGLAVILIGLGLLAFAVFARKQYEPSPQWLARPLLWTFAGWLPISGLFYLPHMKISFTSPHYGLLILPGAAMLFGATLEKFEVQNWTYRRAILGSLMLALAFRQASLYWVLNHSSH